MTISSAIASQHFSLLDADEARAEKSAHEQRVEQLTRNHLDRRARGERHPVWDFMFSYYPTTPGKLAHWHTGALRGIVASADFREAECDVKSWLPHFKNHYQWQSVDSNERTLAWALNADMHWQARGKTVRYVHTLLTLTLHRPPQLGCFGLHEWAMVYREQPRHPEPLRLGAAETNAVVENSQLKCTHYDAFRFFTKEAAPQNALTPTRETQPALEQPGCLHATMDLYKWATKLGPLLPGKLWLDCFELACDVRRLDMEASPYDLSEWGFTPVKIETPHGRAEYVRRQQALMQRGQHLRKRIVAILEAVYPFLATTSQSS